jgi:hypothetical protein
MRVFYFLGWCSCLAGLCFATTASAQSGRLTADSVLKMLQKRLSQFESVEYKLQGRQLFPKGIITLDENAKPLKPALPLDDLTRPLKRSFLLDFCTF